METCWKGAGFSHVVALILAVSLLSDCFMGSCSGAVQKAPMSHSKGPMGFPSTGGEGDSCLSLWLGDKAHLSNASFLLDVWRCDLCKEGL